VTETTNQTDSNSQNVNESGTTKQEAIREVAYRRPLATYDEIADEADVSKGYVARTVDNDRELREIRDAYRSGVEIPATSGTTSTIATAVESLHPTLAKRIREDKPLDNIESIEIRLKTDESDN